MGLIPQTPLGPLGRLAAEAEARAIRRAIVTPIAPRRFPPNIWAAAIVGGALLYLLYRQWQEAIDNPVQGPPIALAPGAPAANNERATPAGTPLQQSGTYGGTWRPSSGSLLDWTVTATVTQYLQDYVGAPCVFNNSFTFTYSTYTPQDWVPYFEGVGPGCNGHAFLNLMRGPRTGGGAGELIESFGGDAYIVVNSASFVSNPGSGGGTIPTTSPFTGTPAADPIDVAGQVTPGTAVAGVNTPRPRIGTPPIGAPLPGVAGGTAVGAGGTGVGVPASAIPSAPSIGSTGARDATSAAQAAAAAAAAAAAVGTIGATGALTGVQAPAIPTTPAGALVLPGVTLFPQAVTGTIAAIAAEVGRLESKAEFQIGGDPGGGGGGPNIWDAIEAILDFLAAMTDGAPAQTWTLAEGCTPAPGAEPESRTVEIPETSDNQASMHARFDALAELIQHHKDLRGPICRGRRPEGVGVTVNFRSLAGGGAGGRPLRKELSYRDLGGGSLATHTAHWTGFQWSAGPVVVSHDESRLGSMKVWAADEEEGMRVIRHAASAAGVNPDTEGVWSVVEVESDRLGRSGTMAPQDLGGGTIAVTVRPGSSGLPDVL